MPRGVNRIDSARLQGRLWTPALLPTSTIGLWLDASDISTISCDGSGNVSEWRDKSGNARHFSHATSGNRPAYSSLTGTVQFRSSGTKYLSCSSVFATALALSGGITVAVATTFQAAPTTSMMIWAEGSTGSDTPFLRIAAGQAVGGRWAWAHRNDANTLVQMQASNTTVFINGEFHVAIGTCVTGAQTAFRDDDTTTNLGTTSAFSGATTINVASVGAQLRTTAAGAHDEDMAELIIVAGVDTNLRRRLAGYLAWKYSSKYPNFGVANLPAEHPFKRNPPLIGV